MSSVPHSARRTFDRAAATSRAIGRETAEEEEVVLAPLSALPALEDEALAFERRVGRTEIVVQGSRAQGGGFYCADCDSLHKDSNRYLTHITGRSHLNKIGMSTQARRATVDEVLQAFEVERRRLRGEDADDAPPLNTDERARASLGLPVSFGSK